MSGKSDFLENMTIDGMLRGGCLTTAGAAGSSAVVKGILSGTTAYVVGDIVVPHSTCTGAGGKLLRCTTAGTSAAIAALAIPNPGTTLGDGTVTWTAIATIPALNVLYFGLLTTNPTDAGGGTEVSGGSYARVAVNATLANFAGTQSAASTTASSGTGGVTSNNNVITFPTPTGNWGVVTGLGVYDSLTAGNLLWWVGLTVSKTVNNADAAPNFPAASFTLTED